MRDNVLIRKRANIILMLAKALKITPEDALDVFYATDANRLLSDKKYGMHLMSNRSIVRDIVFERTGRKMGRENPGRVEV